MKRLVIVNADDYGLSPGTDEGIRACAAAGVVTSVSVLALRADRDGIARLLDAAPDLGLGLHADLTSDLRSHRAGDAARRIREQWECFHEVAGRAPDHADTHKHSHRDDAEVLEALAALGVPVRATGGHMRRVLRRAGLECSDHFAGGVGPRPWWTARRFAETLRRMSSGITEIMCHPGRGDDVPEILSYRGQRAGELRVFSSRAWVQRMTSLQIQRTTFRALGAG